MKSQSICAKPFRRYAIAPVICTLLVFLCGCEKHDTTTIGWHPANPIGVEFTWSNDGLYKLSGGVPVGALAQAVGFNVPIDSAGILTIGHEFDMRQDATYIVIRNRPKGIDQVFQIGVRGYVELALSGEHRLFLHNEGENKFVIDDSSFDPIKITFYPQGEERASIPFNHGPDFVFLSDHRLHIEHPSLSHPGLNGSGILGSLNLHRDDAFSLDSVESVEFKRNLLVSQLVFHWKSKALINEEDLVVNLPKGGDDLKADVSKFESSLNSIAPDIRFDRSISRTWIKGFRKIFVGYIVGFVILILSAPKLISHFFSPKGGWGCIFFGLLLIFVIVPAAFVILFARGYDYNYFRYF